MVRGTEVLVLRLDNHKIEQKSTKCKRMNNLCHDTKDLRFDSSGR